MVAALQRLVSTTTLELHLFLVPDSSSVRSHVQRLQVRILSEKGAFRERSLIRASNARIGTENYT